MPGTAGTRPQGHTRDHRDQAAWELPAEPASVAQIRAGVRAFALSHGASRSVLDDMSLAVSEAVTNAVMHAFVDREPGTIRATVEAYPGELIVVVSDDGRGMQPRPDSPGLGLGLPLIGQLAASVDLRQPAGGGAELCLTFAVEGMRGTPPRSPEDDQVERQRLLEDVGRTADGAWPGEGVERLVDLLVPTVADACAVDVVGAVGPPQRVAARIHGPDSHRRSLWMTGLPSPTDVAQSATSQALADRRAHVAELTPDHIAAITRSEEDAAEMAATGLRWWAVVPLGDAERVHGLLHFGMREERGRPGESELALFEEIAARASGALLRTRLVDELRQSRRRFERILDVLAEAVTVRDAEGRMVYANDAAARLLGAPSREALLGARPGELAARLQLTRENGDPITLDDLPGSSLLAGRDAPPLLARAIDPATQAERWLVFKASRLDDDVPLAVTITEDVTQTHSAG